MHQASIRKAPGIGEGMGDGKPIPMWRRRIPQDRRAGGRTGVLTKSSPVPFDAVAYVDFYAWWIKKIITYRDVCCRNRDRGRRKHQSKAATGKENRQAPLSKQIIEFHDLIGIRVNHPFAYEVRARFVFPIYFAGKQHAQT